MTRHKLLFLIELDRVSTVLSKVWPVEDTLGLAYLDIPNDEILGLNWRVWVFITGDEVSLEWAPFDAGYSTSLQEVDRFACSCVDDMHSTRFDNCNVLPSKRRERSHFGCG